MSIFVHGKSIWCTFAFVYLVNRCVSMLCVCLCLWFVLCECVRVHLCKSVQCVMCVFVSMGLCECVHVRIHVTVP